MKKNLVDVGLVVGGMLVWAWAFVMALQGGWRLPAPVMILLVSSGAASLLVPMVSRRRGWTVLTAWDEVLLAPTGALLPMSAAVLVHLVGGLVTSVSAAGQGKRRLRLSAVGRDALAGLVQVSVVSRVVHGNGAGTGRVVVGVLAGLLARWCVEQAIVAVRARAIAPRIGLLRTSVVEPIMSYAPVGLLVAMLLAMSSNDPWLIAGAAPLSLALLVKLSMIERQRDHNEQAAGVMALGERLRIDTSAETMLDELLSVARQLWPHDRVVVQRQAPAGGLQAGTSLDVADERVWLVLERPAERDAPDAVDLQLLDALAQTVNGVLARRHLLETMRAAQEIRGAVMAAVAHDIRAPLALLTGGVTTLRHHGPNLTDDQRDLLLGPIERAGARMQGLVDDLLDLERLSLSGPTEDITRGQCDPRQVVEQVAQGLDLQGHLRFEGDLAPPQVAMPARLLARVAENLLVNATKHSPRDASITVSFQTNEEAVRIHVDDQGAGVPDIARATIFAAFEQLDDHAKDQGVGLGLYVVGRFVKACHGRIWVDEAPTGGASFRIDLPTASPRERRAPHAVPLPAT